MSTSKFYRIDSEVSEYWAGWYFESGSFFDPEGNAYRPEDLRATWYGRQFWQSEAGTTAEICLLKSVLRQRIEELSAALIVEVRRHDLAGGRLIGRMEISRGGLLMTCIRGRLPQISGRLKPPSRETRKRLIDAYRQIISAMKSLRTRTAMCVIVPEYEAKLRAVRNRDYRAMRRLDVI